MTRLVSLQATTRGLSQAAIQDDTLAYWIAEDFLRAVALTLLDWAWSQIMCTAEAVTARWTGPARALERWIMPELTMRLAIISVAIAEPSAANTLP